ncbi:unnamed protein product, partial [Iphiclides podalirius]
MLEKVGFQETIIVVLDEDKSNILNALEKCPLKIKYELLVIPSEEDWGTANSLKNISHRVTTDLVIVSGDLITNVNLNEVLNLYRKHDAALATLFFNNGPEEWIELPGLPNHGYESKIRKMSAYNDHTLGNKAVYCNDLLRCYAHIPDKTTFGIRVNTLSSFCLSNKKIMTKWEELTGLPLTDRIHANSEVKTKQIDEMCIVGEKTLISERTSIKSSFIGANCTIENKVRLTNCILMNNVTVKEGCVLQDCIVYTGATLNTGCSFQYCLIGPHHLVPASSSGVHQLYAETTDNVITLG